MTASAVTSPFEPIVLEDDPAFDVKKEYQDELDYYYETHPEDHGYIPPKSLKDSAVSMLGGIRNGIIKVVETRDELYGYNDKTKGPRIHLKPVDEMEFLPGGMGGKSEKSARKIDGDITSPFDSTGLSLPKMDFGLHQATQHHAKTEKHTCSGKKTMKKHSCCSCKDTGCLDNPRHCSREGKEKKQEHSESILDADPFGMRRFGKKLF